MPPVVVLWHEHIICVHAHTYKHTNTCNISIRDFFYFLKACDAGRGAGKITSKRETTGVNEEESMWRPNYQSGVFFLLSLNHSSTLIHTSLSGQHCSPKAAVCNFLYSCEACVYKKHMIVSQP